MQLGIFMDLRNPPGWRRPWVDHYRQALDVVTEAEHLGAASVWFTEHHGFNDGYLTQPLILAAAVAARTTRIRIGTAVVLAALRHPRHLAEEAAILDLVSGGRIELGLGAGYASTDFDLFGADITTRFPATDAAISEVRRLLDTDELAPPSVQNPFPLWLGYQGPKGARRAGRLGTGLLSLDRALLQPYLRGLAEGGFATDTARVGGLLNILISDDPEQTLERVLPYYAHHVNTIQTLHSNGVSEPAPWTPDTLREQILPGSHVLGLSVLTPDEAINEITTQTAGLPAAHVYLRTSIAGMPDDMVQCHLELALE